MFSASCCSVWLVGLKLGLLICIVLLIYGVYFTWLCVVGICGFVLACACDFVLMITSVCVSFNSSITCVVLCGWWWFYGGKCSAGGLCLEVFVGCVCGLE